MRKPFAAHLRFVSSFLPNRLCILIQIQHITYDTFITCNRELHSLRNMTQDLHLLLFIIQHNFNKNNKQALQYSANNKKTRNSLQWSIISKQFALKHFFLQQHCLVTVMISSIIHLNKRKKITRCFKVRCNLYMQFYRLHSYFNRFFPTSITQELAEVSYLVCIPVLFMAVIYVA